MRFLAYLGHRTFLVARIFNVSPQLTKLHQKSATSDENINKLRVKTFGVLKTRTGLVCDVHVKPVDPQQFPDQNVAFVDFVKSQLPLKVLYEEECLCVEGNQSSAEHSKTSNGAVCSIQVPIKYDVDAVLENCCSISIENLNNDLISIVTEQGSCQLNKILTGTATVQSKGGDITSRGILQGNVTLTTEGAGKITVHKALAQYFVATTAAGAINIKSLYADESRLSLETGNIDIGSAHRSVLVSIATAGNLNIGSLDGSLTAELKEGHISLHVSRHSGIDISTQKGDIDLKLPDSLMTRLELRGLDISVDEQLNTDDIKWTKVDSTVKVTGVLHGSSSSKEIPKGLPTIKAHTSNGRVRVTQQDWFSTLKLTTLNKDIS